MKTDGEHEPLKDGAFLTNLSLFYFYVIIYLESIFNLTIIN